MGLEGLVSKRRDRAYRADRYAHWIKMLWGGADGEGLWHSRRSVQRHQRERHMSQPFEASRSLTALEQDSTIIAVIEMATACGEVYH